MGTVFSGQATHHGGAPIIDRNRISVAVNQKVSEELNLSSSQGGGSGQEPASVLRTGNCLVDSVNELCPDSGNNTVSCFYSQRARYIELCAAPTDADLHSLEPSWYKRQDPRYRSAFKIKMGHNTPKCNAQVYAEACHGREMPLGRNYKAAACIICQDSEGRFLLTRRQKNMGFFPRAWVFPGGHLEVDEGLEEGALREFHEEVGIEVKTAWDSQSATKKFTYHGHEISVKPVYAFESTTSCDLRDPSQPKPPRVSHLVLFYQLQLPVPCSQIPLKMQLSEVEATAWLDLTQVEKILERRQGAENEQIEHSLHVSASSRQLVQGSVTLQSLFPFYPNEVGEGLVGAARILLTDFLEAAQSK